MRGEEQTICFQLVNYYLTVHIPQNVVVVGGSVNFCTKVMMTKPWQEPVAFQTHSYTIDIVYYIYGYTLLTYGLIQ